MANMTSIWMKRVKIAARLRDEKRKKQKTKNEGPYEHENERCIS
jgi:hypothetical protein